MQREGEAAYQASEAAEKPTSASQRPVVALEGPYGPRWPFLGAQDPTFLLCAFTYLTAGGGGWTL